MMLIVIIYSLSLFGTTIYVPDDYSTIQGAIDAAANGDIIIIYPGEYHESINYSNKILTIASRFYETGNELYILNTKLYPSPLLPVVLIPQLSTGSKLLGFSIESLGHIGINARTGDIEIANCNIHTYGNPSINLAIGNLTDPVKIYNCKIYSDEGTGIYSLSECVINISNTRFIGNKYALYILGISPIRNTNLYIDSSLFENTTECVLTVEYTNCEIQNSLISDNDGTVFKDIGLQNSNLSLQHVTIAGNEIIFDSNSLNFSFDFLN